MTFDDYWTKLQAKNPIPENGSVRLTKGQFCAILKQSYEIGKSSTKKSNEHYDFLRDFFGSVTNNDK